MLAEIIRKTTKCDENANIHSENMLILAKRSPKSPDSGNQ